MRYKKEVLLSTANLDHSPFPWIRGFWMEWSGQRMKQGQLWKLKVSKATLLKHRLTDTSTYAETHIRLPTNLRRGGDGCSRALHWNRWPQCEAGGGLRGIGWLAGARCGDRCAGGRADAHWGRSTCHGGSRGWVSSWDVSLGGWHPSAEVHEERPQLHLQSLDVVRFALRLSGRLTSETDINECFATGA